MENVNIFAKNNNLSFEIVKKGKPHIFYQSKEEKGRTKMTRSLVKNHTVKLLFCFGVNTKTATTMLPTNRSTSKHFSTFFITIFCYLLSSRSLCATISILFFCFLLTTAQQQLLFLISSYTFFKISFFRLNLTFSAFQTLQQVKFRTEHRLLFPVLFFCFTSVCCQLLLLLYWFLVKKSNQHERNSFSNSLLSHNGRIHYQNENYLSHKPKLTKKWHRHAAVFATKRNIRLENN